jgi:hypothetical protein
MKRLLTCLVLTLPLQFCGCVPSLHALYSGKEVVFLNMMNPEWLGKYLKDHPQAIAHTMVDDRVVLTAPTDELQTFVDKHKDTEKAFGIKVNLAKQ